MKKAVLIVMVVIMAAIMLPLPSFAYLNPTMPEYGRVDRAINQRAERVRARQQEAVYGRGYGSYDDYDDGTCDRSYGRNGGRSDRSEFSVDARTKIGNTVIDLGFLNQIVKQSSNRGSKPTVVVVKEPVQPIAQPTSTVVEQAKTETVRYSVVKDKTNEPVGALEFPKATDLQKVLAVGNHIKYSRGGTFLAEYEIVKVLGQFIYVNTLDESGGKPQGNDDFAIVAAQ